jgi:polyphosphate kinase
LSENVKIISVAGRFLDHARIYYFHNGGNEEYYIGSADLMTRNLESRVEVVAPVDDDKLTQELRLILDVQLSSKKHVWEMQQDGTYEERTYDRADESVRSSQQTFIELASKRKTAAAKHRQSKLREKLLTYFHKRVLDES